MVNFPCFAGGKINIEHAALQRLNLGSKEDEKMRPMWRFFPYNHSLPVANRDCGILAAGDIIMLVDALD